MSDIIPGPAVGETGGARSVGFAGRVGTDPDEGRRARLAELVDESRRRFESTAGRQRYPDAQWGDLTWKPRGRQRADDEVSVNFVRYGAVATRGVYARADALSADTDALLRCYCVQRSNVAPKTVARASIVIRVFDAFVRERETRSGEPWSWHRIATHDYAQFERWMEVTPSVDGVPRDETSRAQYMNLILQFGAWLYAAGVATRRPRYTPVASEGSEARYESPEARADDAERKLPPAGMLEAIADLYFAMTAGEHREKATTYDLIVISLIMLLMLTGRRVGEILTLPVDCERRQRLRRITRGAVAVGTVEVGPPPAGGTPPSDTGGAAAGDAAGDAAPAADANAEWQYGIAYYVQKTGQKELRIYWVPETVAPIVRECIERIRALTAEARTRAAENEAHRELITLPAPYAAQDELTTSEVLALIGSPGMHTIPRWLQEHGLVPRRRMGGAGPNGYGGCQESVFTPAEVRAALQRFRRSRTGKADYSRRFDDGSDIPLSETLAICFWRAGDRRRLPHPIFVEMVTANAISRRLDAREEQSTYSLFEVFGTPDQVTFARTHSHAFRHWLTSVAFEGGADLDTITEVFGRANRSHSRDYVHTLDERRAPVADAPTGALSHAVAGRPGATSRVPSDEFGNERANGPSHVLSYEEIGDDLQEGIRMGRYFGPVALTYWRKVQEHGREVADEWLRGYVRVGHVTPWGLCSRDLSAHACEKHLNCLDDCEHFVGTIGDPAEIAALEEQASWQRYAILQGEAAEMRGEQLPAGYLEMARRKLSRLEYALSVHRGATPWIGRQVTFVTPVRPTRVLPVLA